jgi:segregation and condensation protein B
MDQTKKTTGQLLNSAALRYRQPYFRCTSCPANFRALHNPFFRARLSEEPFAPRGPCARDERLAKLEAVLLLAKQPLVSRKLAQLAGLADGTKARTLVRALNRLYDNDGCAFRVEEVAGGFQLMTRPKFAPWLRRLHSTPIEVRLSSPAMETLAVVAYRQPVVRAEIEAIRGVQCDEVLRQLIERELVHIVGRSEELGRPMLYGTTRKFLRIFGLRHLDELPRIDIMRNSNATAPDGVADKKTNQLSQNYEVEEETTVKTSVTIDELYDETLADSQAATALLDERASRLMEEAALDEDLDEDEDFDDDEFDDDEEDEEDEELDDEPWEEVDDEDDDDFDDEDDEDWDDDDEDWDDDDWDDDEDEDEEVEDDDEP